VIINETTADQTGGGGPGTNVSDAPRFWRSATVIATGIFVTGLGWPGLIGRLPFGLLLKNSLGLPPEKVAAFWAVATLAWYLKPLAGLICDSLPLFGTRRRGYLISGAIVAVVAWAAFAVLPRAYGPFLVLMTGLNVALVVINTTVGGMLVEEGQRLGATGRLSALRTGLEGAMSLVAGPLGGILAAAAFAWTSVAGALVVALVLPVTLILYREPRRAVTNVAVWTAAATQLRQIIGSRPMWMTSILLFLVYLAPGLQTPLLYYQQDVLKLDVRFMGILQFAGGAGVLAGSGVYIWLCRRWPLRLTLIGGILLNAAAALLYLGYRSAPAALVIDTTAGFVVALGTLPLYDLAARATPAGSESFGFALMMSIRNIALYGVSDVVGSLLYGRFHLGFDKLVWINATSSAAVLLFVPFLPAGLLAAREGHSRAEDPRR
jgi:hypothetical protein